jgi:MoaE-MoaD fusion protein
VTVAAVRSGGVREVEVRLFGGLGDRVGASRITVRVDDGATVADLLRAVGEAHPEIAPLLVRTNPAVDLEVARPDTPLGDATEVALLPPVAGGAGGRDVRVVTGLAPPPLDVEGTVAAVATPGSGGTVVFLGTVRDHSGSTGEVARLDYSAYDAMAEAELARIADEVASDHPAVNGIALVHALGELAVGDHTILVVVSCGHRGEAFAACADALERVKDRVPVFKHEHATDGTTTWVGLGHEPPPADRS